MKTTRSRVNGLEDNNIVETWRVEGDRRLDFAYSEKDIENGLVGEERRNHFAMNRVRPMALERIWVPDSWLANDYELFEEMMERIEWPGAADYAKRGCFNCDHAKLMLIEYGNGNAWLCETGGIMEDPEEYCCVEWEPAQYN